MEDIKEWRKDVSEIVSPTQLKEVRQDVDKLKTFKCVLWASGERLNYLNKKNPKDEKHDMPFIMQTKYIDIESYE